MWWGVAALGFEVVQRLHLVKLDRVACCQHTHLSQFFHSHAARLLSKIHLSPHNSVTIQTSMHKFGRLKPLLSLDHDNRLPYLSAARIGEAGKSSSDRLCECWLEKLGRLNKSARMRCTIEEFSCIDRYWGSDMLSYIWTILQVVRTAMGDDMSAIGFQIECVTVSRNNRSSAECVQEGARWMDMATKYI